jgi:hypothetical protein
VCVCMCVAYIMHSLERTEPDFNCVLSGILFYRMALTILKEPWPLLQFRNNFFTQTVGLLGRVLSLSQGCYIPIHRTIQTQNKRTQTSMPRVGFEATISASEREKTFHALDRAATVIGSFWNMLMRIT